MKSFCDAGTPVGANCAFGEAEAAPLDEPPRPREEREGPRGVYVRPVKHNVYQL